MIEKIKKFIFSQSMLLILFLIIIVVSVIAPQFFTIRNIFNIFRQVSVLAIMAIGMTYVIIGKGIDLSIHGILGLCAIAGMLIQPYGYWLSIIVSIIIGITCGLLNGYLIGFVKANPIIVTLSTGLIYLGLAFIISKGEFITNPSEGVYSFIGNASILGIPAVLYLYIIFVLVFGIILKSTIYGRQLYAIGANEEASKVAGIKTPIIKMLSYVILGFTIGVAALVYTSRLNTVRVDKSDQWVFDVITIVVLGGTALSGGVGNMYKTVIGLMVFSVLNNSIGIMNMPFEYALVLKGLVLISAVIWVEFSVRKRLNAKI